MPKDFKSWLVFFGAQAALTVAWKLIFKLGENAVIGWTDDQIGAALGITSPALSTVAAWVIPFALAAGTLWVYHRYFERRVPSSVALRIENGIPVPTFGASSVVDRGENDFSINLLSVDRFRKTKLEPIHFIILGIVVALGAAIWQWRATPVSAGVSANPAKSQVSKIVGPEYLKDTSLYSQQQSPLMLVGISTVTTRRLRIFADIGVKSLGIVWSKPERIQIADLKDVVKGQRYTINLIRSDPPHFWWNVSGDEKRGVQSMFRLRIVVINDSDTAEQTIYFFAFQAGGPMSQSFQFLTEKESDWIREWRDEP